MDYHIISNIQLNQISTYKRRVVSDNRKIALRHAVKAFRRNGNVGIGVQSSLGLGLRNELYVAIHSRRGTGVIRFHNLSGDFAYHSANIVDNCISEYFDRPIDGSATWDQFKKAYAEFEGASDPVLTDLVYGPAVMHTNIDDNKLIDNSFALMSCRFSKRKYETIKRLLGFEPIIEFSAVNKRGIETDFLTLNCQIKEYGPYGYFLMKTASIEEKVAILRKRFVSEKIVIILDYPIQKLPPMDRIQIIYPNWNYTVLEGLIVYEHESQCPF